MTPQEIRIISLFSEKADKLAELSFSKYVLSFKLELKVNIEIGKTPTSDHNCPNAEAIDAFILTLRFFVQNNEPISLRNMSNVYQSLMSQSKGTKTDNIQSILDIISSTNRSLDSSSPITIGNTTLTNRCIFETFLYGGLAHSNKSKRAVYEKWRSQPAMYNTLEYVFVTVLVQLLIDILQINLRNKLILEPIL
jgi:hypothetical protein